MKDVQHIYKLGKGKALKDEIRALKKGIGKNMQVEP